MAVLSASDPLVLLTIRLLLNLHSNLAVFLSQQLFRKRLAPRHDTIPVLSTAPT